MLVVIAASTITLRVLFGTWTIAHGGAAVGLVGSLLVASVLVVSAWAIGHAVGTPSRDFHAIGRTKWRWVAAMVASLAVGDVIALAIVLYYVLRVRPRLNDVANLRRATSDRRR